MFRRLLWEADRRINNILMMNLIRYGTYVVYGCNSEQLHINNAEPHLSEVLLKEVDIFSTILKKSLRKRTFALKYSRIEDTENIFSILFFTMNNKLYTLARV